MSYFQNFAGFLKIQPFVCLITMVLTSHSAGPNPLAQTGSLNLVQWVGRNWGCQSLRALVGFAPGIYWQQLYARTSLLRIWFCFFFQTPYKVHTTNNDTECSLGPVEPLPRKEPTSRICKGERAFDWYLRGIAGFFIWTNTYMGVFKSLENLLETLNPWETERGHCQWSRVISCAWTIKWKVRPDGLM